MSKEDWGVILFLAILAAASLWAFYLIGELGYEPIFEGLFR